MNFELKDLLEAIGPTASLVFAAWIFLGFLETRYVAAFERYRELADDYRKGDRSARHEAVQSQIRLYRRRCEWIRLSTNIGLVSAIALLCTLIFAALNVIFPGRAVFTAAAAVCAVAGLLLVVIAGSIVIIENIMIGSALRDEVADVPELQGRKR